MSTLNFRKLVSRQLNELGKTVNELEKKAKKILDEGKKKKTFQELSHQFSKIRKQFEKDPHVKKIINLTHQTLNSSHINEYLPVRRKEFKNLEKKLNQLSTKVDTLKKASRTTPQA